MPVTSSQSTRSFLHAVLNRHGGLARWSSARWLQGTAVIGGPLWARAGRVFPTEAQRVSVAVREEFASLAPFGDPAWRLDFSPERVALLGQDGELVAERLTPRARFARQRRDPDWDLLEAGYLAGCSVWTNLNVPFLLALPGVQVRDAGHWRESRETWRVLEATLPPNIESHSAVQHLFFDGELRLRRQDYRLDIAGGMRVAQYVDEVVDVDGITLATRHRSFLVDADGNPQWTDLQVSMRFEHLTVIA